MDHIIRNFYIGNKEDSENIELLKKYGIRCIINCTNSIENKFPGIFWYLNIPLEDPDPNIYHFCGTILHQLFLVKDIPTLIHCRMGISRSVTVLTYFLSNFLNCDPMLILEKIKGCRPIIDPHPYFINFLKEKYSNPDKSN